jgi:hypothetical protein
MYLLQVNFSVLQYQLTFSENVIYILNKLSKTVPPESFVEHSYKVQVMVLYERNNAIHVQKKKKKVTKLKNPAHPITDQFTN